LWKKRNAYRVMAGEREREREREKDVNGET
jgi:hypothetical protein